MEVFWSTLLYNVAELIEVCSIHSCRALLKRRLRSEFSLSLFQPFCSRFVAVCGTSFLSHDSVLAKLLLTSDSGILCYTKDFIVHLMTTKCPGPVTEKQALLITPPPPCLTISMRCFVLMCSVCFCHQKLLDRNKHWLLILPQFSSSDDMLKMTNISHTNINVNILCIPT